MLTQIKGYLMSMEFALDKDLIEYCIVHNNNVP